MSRPLFMWRAVMKSMIDELWYGNRNNVVRVASELGKLSDQPSREIDYDYSQ